MNSSADARQPVNPSNPNLSSQKKLSGLALGSFICGLFFIIPILGFLTSLPAIILGVIALVVISKRSSELKGNGLAIAGIVMGAIGIIIPVMALVAAIAIPNMLRAKITANDANAQASIRTLSAAAEAFSAVNGRYPTDISQLTEAKPPYLNEDPCFKITNEFMIECVMSASEYVFTARPLSEGVSGSATFTVSTGGIFAVEGSENLPNNGQMQKAAGNSSQEGARSLDADTREFYDQKVSGLQQQKIKANDDNALATLKVLATAAEAYNAVNGFYPSDISALMNANPPFLTMNPCSRAEYGFFIDCATSRNGYEFKANPVSKGVSGSADYAISTEAILYINGIRQN